MPATLKSHVRRQTIENVVTNTVFNGALGWWMMKDSAPLTAFGWSGYALDFLITGFLMAGLVALAMIKLHQVQLSHGDHQPVPLSAMGMVARIPADNIWLCSGLFGLAGLLLSAIVVGACVLLELPPFDPALYALMKGVWTGVLAALVVPPAILIGLRGGA